MGGDVDEGDHLRVDTRLGDDGSAVAVTDEDAGAILLLQDPPGRGHVVVNLPSGSHEVRAGERSRTVDIAPGRLLKIDLAAP